MLEQISARALEEKCRACIEARVDDASRAAAWCWNRARYPRLRGAAPGYLLPVSYGSLDAPPVSSRPDKGRRGIQSIESREGANPGGLLPVHDRGCPPCVLSGRWFCYETFRRKYFYIILAVCLGLEAVLLWGYWTTWKWGNSNVDFYSTAIMVPFMLSIGLYATIVTGDIVFSEQYKNNTLKNEVSYGLSRGRIYLGKLLVSTGIAVLAAVVMMGFYLGLCWVLFPHTELDGMAWQLIGYCLAGGVSPVAGRPGHQVNACCVLVRGTNTPARVHGRRTAGGIARHSTGVWNPVPPGI
ncbi:MAG: ABC transporter permease [Flavonifractor plautii]